MSNFKVEKRRFSDFLKPSDWLTKNSVALLLSSIFLGVLAFAAPMLISPDFFIGRNLYIWSFGFWKNTGYGWTTGFIELFQSFGVSFPFLAFTLLAIGVLLTILGSIFCLKPINDKVKRFGGLTLTLGSIFGIIGLILYINFNWLIHEQFAYFEYARVVYRFSPSFYACGLFFLFYCLIGFTAMFNPIEYPEKSISELKTRKISFWIMIIVFVPFIGSFIYNQISLQDWKKVKHLTINKHRKIAGNSIFLDPIFNNTKLILQIVLTPLLFWPLMFTLIFPGSQIVRYLDLAILRRVLLKDNKTYTGLILSFILSNVILFLFLALLYLIGAFEPIVAYQESLFSATPILYPLITEIGRIMFTQSKPIYLGLLIASVVVARLFTFFFNIFWQKKYNDTLTVLQLIEKKEGEKAFELEEDTESIVADIKLLDAANDAKAANKLDLAITIYKKILDETPEDIESIVSLAEIYERKKQYVLAINHYERALHYNPKTPVYHALVDIYQNQDDYDEVIRVLQKAIKNDVDKIKNLCTLGQVYIKFKEYDDAIKTYLEVITLDEKHLSAIFELANIYFQKELFESAIDWYKEALKIDENYVPALIQLSSALLEKDEVTAALEYIQKANQLKPADKNIKKILRKCENAIK